LLGGTNHGASGHLLSYVDLNQCFSVVAERVRSHNQAVVFFISGSTIGSEGLAVDLEKTSIPINPVCKFTNEGLRWNYSNVFGWGKWGSASPSHHLFHSWDVCGSVVATTRELSS